MKDKILLFLVAFAIIWISSCKEKSSSEEEQEILVSVKTTKIIQSDIQRNIDLNGTTIYLRKNSIVSPLSGYILKLNVKYGDLVHKNDILFEVQTKENKALENSDSLAGNIGIVKVLASSGGIISEINVNQTGGYILEGDNLCSIVENNDVMVQVNVPFEYNSLLKAGAICKLILPDNSIMEGAIYNILPRLNEENQTQDVLIKPSEARQLPENLNLRVQFVYTKHNNSLLVAKNVVMANETQSEFWIMKIADGSIAIKVPVIKGIENDSLVEIISRELKKDELVISEGAYGLTDSTVVRIVD